jgi:excisionase family DNA binding protein
MKHQAPVEERLAVSVKEAARLLGISPEVAYRAVQEGEIPSIRIGGRILVPRAGLE